MIDTTLQVLETCYFNVLIAYGEYKLQVHVVYYEMSPKKGQTIAILQGIPINSYQQF